MNIPNIIPSWSDTGESRVPRKRRWMVWVIWGILGLFAALVVFMTIPVMMR